MDGVFVLNLEKWREKYKNCLKVNDWLWGHGWYLKRVNYVDSLGVENKLYWKSVLTLIKVIL